MDAREVVIIITGLAKAYALYKCIEEGVNHMWTVSAIQMHKYVRERQREGFSPLLSHIFGMLSRTIVAMSLLAADFVSSLYSFLLLERCEEVR